MTNPVLEVDDLYTHFFTRERGVVKAINGVSFSLNAGEIVALVGESGSGKTVTALSILNIVPFPGRIFQGSIKYRGEDLVGVDEEKLRYIRGEEIAMIFQDPLAALNPVMNVGDQILEVIGAHRGHLSNEEKWEMASEAIKKVGLSDPERILTSFPFQLSGGMAQRIMLAIGLMMEPAVLIADEPTSALDVTLQAEIMEHLRSLKELHDTAVLLITHDMGLVAQMADHVLVMYAGSVVESGDVDTIFRRPAHPYTWALLQSVPRLDSDEGPLRPLPGSPPDLTDLPDECPFISRCHRPSMTCRTSPRPALKQVGADQVAACYHPLEPLDQ
ncbi:MAG: ABC transporter ATP-binding protein [SAR202 cluster bacterium]|nr:ABC transporter ATP-binding protein [SAR202 cluster bacterium]|tara:strand:+ start:2777 stop:3766 length:990 start_codon:yes stop_codon:yes gene_type:complete